MQKTQDFKDQTLRALNNDELDAVVGGFVNDGGCTRLPTLILHMPPYAPPTKDPFSMYTIGR